MAIKMCKGTLAFLEGLRKRGGKATMALDSRIVLVESKDGTVEITPTDQHPNNYSGTIDFKLGDEVVDTEAAEKEIEETKAKKKSSKKPAAKKKK